MYLTGVVLVLLLLFCLLGAVLLVKYYVDPAESYLLATIVIGLSVSVTMLNVLLIPFDIYALSASTGLSTADLNHLMRAMYLLTFGLNFLLIPFTYFYGEER